METYTNIILVLTATLRVATPLVTLKRVKFTADAEALAGKALEFEAVALIFGLPLALVAARLIRQG